MHTLQVAVWNSFNREKKWGSKPRIKNEFQCQQQHDAVYICILY